MRKFSYKKIFAIAALATLVLVFLPISGPIVSRQQSSSSHLSQTQGSLVISFSPKITRADNPAPAPMNVISCVVSTGGNPATCAVYYVVLLINTILGMLVALGATLATWALVLNGHVFDSPMVQTGFSICLALTNLGFVLGIIIVAIATILRSQTYGAKQILWKLVIMAILVNFGLVITRPIVALSDSMTNYFMIQAGGGGTLDSSTNLALTMMNSVSPQLFNTPPLSAQNFSNAIGNGGTNLCILMQSGGNLFAAVGSKLFNTGTAKLCAQLAQQAAKTATGLPPQNDNFTNILLHMVFSVIFMSVIMLTFFALAILLIVRYVALGILLVLLPLAWLAWIFPQFKSQFSKWWSEFIRWVSFPALAMFFIYLALLVFTKPGTGNGSTSYLQDAAALPSTADQGPASTVAIMTNDVGPIQNALNDTVILAIMIGGLFAASSLAGKAGSVVVGGAKSLAGWVGGAAGKAAARQGKKAAARAVPEGIRNKLQSGQLGGIGRIVPKRLQVAAGIGLANVQKAGTSRLVDQEAAWAKEQGKDVDASARMLSSGGLSEAKKFALLKAINDNKKFDPTKIDKIDSKTPNINAFLQDKNRFDKYGQGSLRDDLNKSTNGASSATMTASAALAAGGGLTSGATVRDDVGLLGEVGATVDALELLRKSIEKTARNMEKNDLKKQNLNYMYSSATINGVNNTSTRDLRIEQLRALIKTKPQLIASHLPGMSSEQIDNFNNVFRVAMAAELDEAIKSNDEARLARLGEVEKSFNKSYSRITSGDFTPPDEVDEKKSDETKSSDGGKK
jgi:hypothetical protein